MKKLSFSEKKEYLKRQMMQGVMLGKRDRVQANRPLNNVNFDSNKGCDETVLNQVAVDPIKRRKIMSTIEEAAAVNKNNHHYD